MDNARAGNKPDRPRMTHRNRWPNNDDPKVLDRPERSDSQVLARLEIIRSLTRPRTRDLSPTSRCLGPDLRSSPRTIRQRTTHTVTATRDRQHQPPRRPRYSQLNDRTVAPGLPAMPGSPHQTGGLVTGPPLTCTRERSNQEQGLDLVRPHRKRTSPAEP